MKEEVCARCSGTGKSPINTLLTNAGDPCIQCGGTGKTTPEDAWVWRKSRGGGIR